MSDCIESVLMRLRCVSTSPSSIMLSRAQHGAGMSVFIRHQC